MSIVKKRNTYKPFVYPKAFEYYQQQRRAHWSIDEVSMAKDVDDWAHELSDGERGVIGEILKSFAQTELHVEEYWARKVTKWFPHPEIAMMAATFSSFEAIHTEGYAHLNDSLGLDDYTAFLADPTAMAKLDRLQETRATSKRDIARSLAIFSAFTEGVNLFSSFAILMGMCRSPWNLLNGVRNIVEWSIRDESLHSEAGCWLFRTLIEENPSLLDDELREEIVEAARLSVKLEDDFIDHAFKGGVIRGLSPSDLKQFIRQRANMKLRELGLKNNWKNICPEAVDRMSWFDEIAGGVNFTDFFAHKVTDYQKSNFNIENLFGK